MSTTEYDQETAFNVEIAKITDQSVVFRLKQIKELVVQRINLEKNFRKEQSKLEAKYEKEYAPLYKERAEIINGDKKVSFEDVKNILSGVQVTSTEESETGIPNYWLTCLKHSKNFADLVNKKDEAVLKYLKDITLDFKESGDFSLLFHFKENEYFKHSELFRHFFLDDKQNIKKIESSKIEWTSEEVNPTVERKKKKLKSKNKSAEIKLVTKLEEVPSFFNFFKDYTAIENLSPQHQHHKKSEDAEDEEEVDENAFIDEEYEVGLFIKDELIPYSLEYYLDLVEDEDSDEEEDDDDIEDDDDDEEEKKPKKKLF